MEGTTTVYDRVTEVSRYERSDERGVLAHGFFWERRQYADAVNRRLVIAH